MLGPTVPATDYLEAFRLKCWGKRDGWAWLFGMVGVLYLIIAGTVLFGASGTGPQAQAAGPAILLLLEAGVGVCFWLGLRFARVGRIVIPLLRMVVHLVSKRPRVRGHQPVLCSHPGPRL